MAFPWYTLPTPAPVHSSGRCTLGTPWLFVSLRSEWLWHLQIPGLGSWGGDWAALLMGWAPMGEPAASKEVKPSVCPGWLLHLSPSSGILEREPGKSPGPWVLSVSVLNWRPQSPGKGSREVVFQLPSSLSGFLANSVGRMDSERRGEQNRPTSSSNMLFIAFLCPAGAKTQ